MVGEKVIKIMKISKKIVSKKFILIISIFQIFTWIVYGDIILSSDRNFLSPNEGLRVRIDFLNEDSKGYKIEGVENFQVIGKSNSRSVSIVNFKRSIQEVEEYLLKPLAMGKYTLKVTTPKGESNQLDIEVTGGNSDGNLSSPEIQEDFLMLSTLNSLENENRKYYFGEKIFIEEKFLLFRNPRGFSVISRPEYRDFLEKDFTPRDRNGNPLQSRKSYNGKESLETILYRGVIQGTSSGKRELKGIGVEVVTGDYYYPGALKKEIEILPLPDGRPENFNGVIGKLEMDYSFNRKSVEVGEPILLTLKFYGDVNLDNLNKIGLTSDEDFTLYETLKNSDERVDESGYYSEKNFEIALIPKKIGELLTPEINISYLDTKNGEYREKKIFSEVLTVAGSSKANETSHKNSMENSNLDDSENEKGSENQVQKTDENSPQNSKLTLISILINILVLLIVLYIGIKKTIKNMNIKKKETPWKIYLKRMGKKSDFSEFYENYCRYMEEKYNFNPKTQSETKLKDEVLKECNREIEKARYLGEEIDRKAFMKKLKEAD